MLTKETYVQRRNKLVETLDSGLVLLIGHDESPMNFTDNPYPFWQDSSFLYYLGLNEPGLAALIDVDENHCTLFGHERTLDEIVWTGELPTLAERGADAGVADCQPPAELKTRLSVAIQGGRTIHCLPPYRDTTTIKIAQLLEVPTADVESIVSRDLVRAVVAQRSIKSAEEVAEIEQAVAWAREIHTLAMRLARPGMREQKIVGAIEGLLMSQGSAVSFPVIFSVRGEVLHNHNHDNIMQEGDLAILDAGAMSRSRYASDITRTFPVGKSFTPRQRDIYQIVLAAEEAAIAALKPGKPYEDVHLLAAHKVAEGLKDLGLMKGDIEAAVEQGAHALFFPHGLGHMMGLDVHDMESLGEDHVGYDDSVARSTQFGRAYLRLAKSLEPGHVITVEPGIYFIPQLIDSWAKEERLAEFIVYDKLDDWKDFGGVRIEDDLLVTPDGYRLLGAPIPKSVDEVEALRSS
jgi:Xaa-Pro aminopeptidase